MVPQKIFFTKGAGAHKDKLVSFEMALRYAGIEKFNLVAVSSIFPPECEIIEREEGLKYLKKGQIVFCVMARMETDNPEEICASVGLAIPEDKSQYGYLSEHHSAGQDGKTAGQYAEEMADIMLSTTLGTLPEEKSGKFKTSHICQSAKGEAGIWTTVVAAAVFAE